MGLGFLAKGAHMAEQNPSAAQSWRRAGVLALCLLLTAVLSVVFKPQVMPEAHARASTPLEQLFPQRFGAWQLDPVTAPLIRPAFEQGRNLQIYDQVLERTYIDDAGHRIMLSVAYGRQQSVGLQMHRPEVCYKAGGFAISDLNKGRLEVPGLSLPVTRLLARMEGRIEPITYWRLLGDEVVADEQSFKLRQLQLGAKSQIADGMLVRVSSISEDLTGAHELHDGFIRELLHAMTPAQRQRVLGTVGQP
jgi:EpsI family protein